MLRFTNKFGIVSIVIIFLYIISICNGSELKRLHRSKRYIEWGPDIAGPYCATRRDGCCPGRIDECSVPILDTLCYCDEFCNRTRGDCCPDFFSFCLGGRTTPSPFRGNHSFEFSINHINSILSKLNFFLYILFIMKSFQICHDKEFKSLIK